MCDDDETQLDEVIVTVGHPWGDVEVSLRTWIELGPGPRYLTRPVAAKQRDTNSPLPLAVIPLRYRNDEESRLFIQRGELENPWPDQADYPERYFGQKT